jgi:alkanesulfonate monooxygenase SsuD/methylene tetrahydromethanopterin reductase-like flavin-dependent oxidoreductase (luciferase family)
MFEEAMEVIVRAFEHETFSYHGAHFDFPPPGIPDRGGTVQELTLVPRPLYPYEIWQPVTSPPTLEYVPRAGWGGVFWLKHRDFIARDWESFGDKFEAAHGRALAPGEKRMLVLNVRIGDTYEAALAWGTSSSRTQ